MPDTKKFPQLPADPMGVFGEPLNQPNTPTAKTKSRASLAKEAAQKRHVDILESIEIQRQFIQEFLNLDHWLVFSEAIPICLGIHPRDTGDINITHIQTFNDTKVAVKSEHGKTLNLINPNDQPALWRIKPVDFVDWMVSQKLNPLQGLVETLLCDEQEEQRSDESESILAAALAILANVPKQCVDLNGTVSANAIYEVMNANATTWFEQGKLPLDKNAIIKRLAKVIETF